MDYPSTLALCLFAMYKYGDFSDITIQVKDRTFHAHKIILIAGSSYFWTLLEGNFKEKIENKIVLSEHDPAIFSYILDTLYGQTPRFNSVQDQFQYIIQMRYFGLLLLDINTIIEDIEWGDDEFPDYLEMVATVYSEGIPDNICETIHSKIDNGVDLSGLSEETISEIFINTKYNPLNLLKFHSYLEKYSPNLFHLINYTLLPQEHRPNGLSHSGPIPFLSANDVIVVGEKSTKIFVKQTPKSPYTEMVRVPVVNSGGVSEKILLLLENRRISVGDILAVEFHISFEDTKYCTLGSPF